MKKDLNYVFNDIPMYTKEKFEVFKVENDKYILVEKELSRFHDFLKTDSNKLISYCHKCKKTFPFEIEENKYCFSDNGSKYSTSDFNLYRGSGMGLITVTDSNIIIGIQPPYDLEKLNINHIWYIQYFFTCANNANHNYMLMLSVEFDDGIFTVRKIGQNPSTLTIKGFDFDKYKNFLDIIDSYEDYKKADLSNADHFHAGAYTYLRRIFEKMINHYLGDTKLSDNHIDTKIDAVKTSFDSKIQKLLKKLYGILSIGIHELSEDQSKEYYSYLKAIIDMQLEFEKSKADSDKQSKELETVIGQIENLVKKN